MTIERSAGCTVITGEHIAMAQALSRRGALKLEIVGLRRRGRSAADIIREAIGSSTRDRRKLLAEYEAHINKVWGIQL